MNMTMLKYNVKPKNCSVLLGDYEQQSEFNNILRDIHRGPSGILRTVCW
jgi:hypothetical protein